MFLLIESYSGSASTLYITVYGRVFKTDSVSSYIAGTLTAQATSSSSTASQTYSVSALPSVAAYAIVSH